VQSILPFLFVLGVLVFVHELGHFLVARWHGVRVLTFSLGFGPKILSFKRGDTEYCVSAVPLGGYVKMAGENADSGEGEVSHKPDELLAKTKWQRFQVYVAGPMMNIVTAVVILTGVYYHGAPEAAYQKNPAVVGHVAPDSPAARADIRKGDLIVSVGGRQTPTWDQFAIEVMPKANREIELVVARDGVQRTVRLTPASRTSFEIGDIGVAPDFHPQIAILNPGEPAANAGLLVGDVVLAVNGVETDYDSLLKSIWGSPSKPLTLTIERDKARRDVTVTPVLVDNQGRIGVTLNAAEERIVAAGFTQAMRLSVQENVKSATLIFRTFGELFKGEASPKQLMGPVGIARLSGAYARLGWIPLFTLMAMLSMNLAILNLLPIPMLDGGHIFIMAIEGAARRDFSLRVKERMLMAGFVVIMTLMVTVIYNDLMRIEWIQKLVPWR
jgi:regulator of sigma E protease